MPLYQLFGGKAREHIELYATSGLPPGVQSGPSLKERAAATMAAGWRVYRVDSGILPNDGTGGPRRWRRTRSRRPRSRAGAAAGAAGGPARTRRWRRTGWSPGRGPGGSVFNTRARIPQIVKALEQIREGCGPDGDFMIDLHQKFDFHEAVEACRLVEPLRPYAVEDPLREEQFRDQLPKLRLLTSVPISAGEEWGTRADFTALVEQRDIDFARAASNLAMCLCTKLSVLLRAITRFTAPPTTPSISAARRAAPPAAHRRRSPQGYGPLSLGSDIVLLRVPAFHCGVYAHKPTFDLVAMRGHVPPPLPPLPSTRDLQRDRADGALRGRSVAAARRDRDRSARRRQGL